MRWQRRVGRRGSLSLRRRAARSWRPWWRQRARFGAELSLRSPLNRWSVFICLVPDRLVTATWADGVSVDSSAPAPLRSRYCTIERREGLIVGLMSSDFERPSVSFTVWDSPGNGAMPSSCQIEQGQFVVVGLCTGHVRHSRRRRTFVTRPPELLVSLYTFQTNASIAVIRAAGIAHSPSLRERAVL